MIAMPASTRDFKTDDRNTTSGKGIARTIKAGEPVAECEYYVVRIDSLVPGAQNTATDVLVGIAEKESTETTAADGVCAVTMLIPRVTVMRGVAHTTDSADSASEVLLLLNSSIVFNASYTVYDASNEGVITLDEDDNDETAHGLKVIAGSEDSQATLDVICKGYGWQYGGTTTS